MPDLPYERSMPDGRGQQGTLTQLPDGRWCARYREGGRGGRRPQKTFDTRAAGAAWLRERLNARRASDPTQRDGNQMCDDFLATHDVDDVTKEKLRIQLLQFRAEFGTRLIQSVEPYELQAWRMTLPPRARHHLFRPVKQVFAQAERWGWIAKSPAADIKNPRPRRREIRIPLWESVLAIADEIDTRYEAIPVFAAMTGLRVEEWSALHRDHVDVDARMIRVRQVYSQGRLVELGADGSKTWRQRRDVPVRRVALEVLASMLTRIDTPLLFPAPRGDYLDSDRWRERYWTPAVRAAGVEHFPPKNLRHVYASESIAAGMDLFTLSRRMGTSLKEIDDTYGHLVHDAHERELALLDDYDVRLGRIEAL